VGLPAVDDGSFGLTEFEISDLSISTKELKTVGRNAALIRTVNQRINDILRMVLSVYD
jgi:hypothetical protein